MNSRCRRVALGLTMGVAVLWCKPALGQDLPNEDALIAVLQSDAGWQPKYEACTRLRRIGTVKSVPALVSLLDDEKLSHMARYALEPMPGAAVDKALRDALKTTSGLQKTGVITTLGVRAEAKSAPLIIEALHDPNADVVRAAAGALGRIATPDAVKALLRFHDSAPPEVRDAVIEGLLAAGRNLTHRGKGRQAVPVYTALLAAQEPRHAREGAFYGLAFAEPRKASTRLLTALKGDDPVFRDVAARIIGETQGDTRTYAAALAALPSEGQAALLRGLGDRGDAAAREAVVQALHSEHETVKIAAIQALAKIGGPDDVVTLAPYLVASEERIATAARIGLGDMKADGVDAAITAAVANAGPGVRSKLLEVLAERMAPQAVSLAGEALKGSDPQLRMAALRVLGQMGGAEDIPAVIRVVRSAMDPAEREEAASTLNAICGVQREAALPHVLAGMEGAEPPSRVLLLRSLGRIGTAAALEPIRTALQDADPAVNDEAVRLLANWPSTEAAPLLLELVRSGNPARREQALRGYVRLAQNESNAEEKARMLTAAMGLAKRPEEKWPVLAAWGTLHTAQSLEALLPYLNDRAVQNEAATAIIAVATAVAKQESGKAAATNALNAVVKQCRDESIRERAQRALSGQ